MRTAVHHITVAALVIVAVAAAVLVQDGPADTGGPSGPPVTAAGDDIEGLRAFDGCEQLTDHVRDMLAEVDDPRGAIAHLRAGTGGFGVAVGTPTASGGGTASGFADSAEAAPRAAPPAAQAGDGDASTTNVQETGIDEPDIVETDGRLLLAVTGDDRLHIVDVTRDAPRLLSSVGLDEGDHQLFLLDERALVMTRSWHHLEPGPISERPGEPDLIPLPIRPAATELTLLDLRDPAAPVQEATATVDGDLVSARAADGTVRLVLRSSPHDLDLRMPTGPAAVDAAAAHNRGALASIGPKQILPHLTVRDSARRTLRDAPAVGCTAVSRPADPSGVGTTTVLTLRPGDGDLIPEDSTSVLADTQIVYASADRLYVATTSWTVRPLDDAPGREDPRTTTRPDGPTTELHAFDTTATTTRHVASGAVEGQLLNQWSLSERDGVLRVAVTRGTPTVGPAAEPTDQPTSDSAIVTLTERAGELVQLGQVDGLGPGERIFAVRYFDDLATVVTFRQIDPLYTVDLSDPETPRVLGELKIPGFSNYLHPVAEGSLLGVGQDADEDGRERGVQVSLFDLRDLTAPQRTANLVIGPGRSEVQHDHHAFLWWADRDLAVVPVQLWGPPEPPVRPGTQPPAEDAPAASSPPHAPWSGAVVVEVDASGNSVREVARLTHTDQVGGSGERAWSASIRRAVVAGDRLLTVSEAGVEAVDLATLEPVGWAAF